MLQAKTNEQYQAFQHEIGFCQSEIRRSEDRILDLMSESEDLDKKRKSGRDRLEDRKSSGGIGKSEARERTEADQKAVNDLGGDEENRLSQP